MYCSVSKRRVQGTAMLFIGCLLLMLWQLPIFMENGVLQGEQLALVLFGLIGGCYLCSVKMKLPTWLNWVWMLASLLVLPYMMVYLVEILAGQNAALIETNLFWMNYFWCLIIYVVLFVCTSHYRFSIIGGSLFIYLVAVVNHFVLLFRNIPLQLADIMSVGTAANVAEHYTIALDYELLLTGSGLFFALCMAAVAEFRFQRQRWRTLILNVVLLCFVGGSVSYFYSDSFWEEQELTMNFWNPLQCYIANGTVLSIALNGHYLKPEKPEAYSPQQVQSIVQAGDVQTASASPARTALISYQPQGPTARSGQQAVVAVNAEQEKPNIITIMNESYSDLRVLGEFQTSVPYMEYMESLQENTIRGDLSVSVVGGGTCNSEFEFLTGMSMAFLPPGGSVYQQFITRDLPSLATTLKAQGYQTVAFHPGKLTSWRRNIVYPYLGFDRYLTTEDMENPRYVRNMFVSDDSSYDTVIQLFEEKGDDKLFLFNVTIQNHGSYCLGTDGIPKWVSVQGVDTYCPGTAEYLSVLRTSDQALERLIAYFEQVDEPTILVFFGDHQPAIEEELVEELLGAPLDQLSMEQLQKRYTVPFFIWANYDIAEATYDQISLNYLSTLVLQTAGLEMTPYHQYLARLQQQVPMINTLGYTDKTGQYHEFTEETAEQQWIEDYKTVQYNYLFGGQGRNDALYLLDAAGE